MYRIYMEILQDYPDKVKRFCSKDGIQDDIPNMDDEAAHREVGMEWASLGDISSGHCIPFESSDVQHLQMIFV